MKKNMFTRMLSVLLALVSLLSVFAVLPAHEAEAATVNASISSVSVNSSGFYAVKSRTAALRSGTGRLDSVYATLKKGALLQKYGETRDHYKVNMNGSVYFIKKSDVSAAGRKTYASLYYLPKAAPLRATPYETGTKIAGLAKGSVVAVVGQLTNRYSNTWLIVSYNGGLFYLYAGNAKYVSKINLKVAGNTDRIMQGDILQLSCSVTSGVNVMWSSSNSAVASVDNRGKVTGLAGGSCEIKASVNGILSVKYKLTVVGYDAQIKNTYASMKRMTGRKNFTNLCGLYAGASVRALGITKEGNYANGNDQYDTYKNLSRTSGGYRVKAYSATRYNLKTALNTLTNNGKTKVTNLLVCFHTGSGDAGRRFGHVVFIHAIVNGRVYFSESFSAYVGGRRYAEGAPIVCSIEQFARYYGSWTTFEGIIHFTK